MIFLYSKLDIQNKGEGLGSLQDFVEEPIVTWNASGFLEVEFRYFLYGDLAEYMTPDAKLKTRIHSNDEVYHLFTIYEVEPDYIENTIQVRAEMTLLHELKDRVVPSGTMRGTANEMIMFVKNKMDRDYPFVITGTADKTVFIEHDNVSAYELIFGEDGILKRTGAEIEFTDRGIRVSDRIGTIHRDELRESDFVTNLTVNELQGEDFVTRIIPFTTAMFDRPVRDGDRYTRETIETPTYGTPVISPNITNKLYKVRTKFVEYRNEPTEVPKYYNYQTDRGIETLEMNEYVYEDVTALNNDASTFFEDNLGIDEPTTTISIETLGLAKGYYTYLRYLNRYDIVTIYVEPKPYLTNTSETYVVQVNETVYEPLSDNLVSIGFTNDSITLRDAYRNVNEGRISDQQLQAELQKERLRDLEDKLVNYVYNHDGFRLEFGNVLPPPDEYREGDLYYLETGEGIDLYKLVNGAWEFLVGQSTREIIEGKIAEIEEQAEELSKDIEASEQKATEAKEEAGIANSAVEQMNTAVVNAGYTNLEEAINSVQSISNTAKTNAQTALNQSLDALGDASTALTNSQTALGRADTAIDSASNAVTKADDAKDAATILSGQVSGFETTVAGFNQTVNNYEGQVSGFRNDISGLESTVASYETEVDEFGNTVSTYATEVSNLTNTVSGFESTVATYGQEVNSLTGEVATYATQVSNFSNTVDGFQSKVDKVEKDYEGVSGTVATHTSQISNLDGDIKLKASTASVNTLSGRVSTAETGISANASAIKLKASQTSVDTLSGKVNTLDSEIDVVSGQISSKVWSTDIETAIAGIAVGGRNLYRQSRTRHGWDTDNYSLYFQENVSVPEWGATDAIRLNFTQGGSDERAAYNFILSVDDPLYEIGNDYIVSGYIKNNATDNSVRIGSHGNGSELIWVSPVESKYFEFPVKLSGASLIIGLYPLKPGNNVNVSLWNIQVEKGNKATDYNLAPEDVDTKINHVESELTQKYDSITTTVSSIDGRVTTNKQTLDSIDTIVSGHGGRLSAVEQTASGLQTTVASKANQSQVTQLETGLSSVVTDLGNLEIGGRNLYQTNQRNHGWATDAYSLNFGEGVTVPEWGATDAIRLLLTQGGSDSRAAYKVIRLSSDPLYEVGDEYIVSGYIKNNTTGNSVRIGSNGNGSERILVSPEDSKYFEFPIKLSGASLIIGLYPALAGNNVDVSLWNIQVEKGNVVTSWTPAPEDMATSTQVSSIEQKANSIQALVGTTKESVARAVMTSNLWETEVVSEISGMSTTVSQLSDSWALTLKSGNDIKTQLNATTNGIRLASKLIHLSGTSLIDDAVIKSAMIDTLDAGKITTGELNASLVRVVNLDANSITGNEANFIQALFSGTKSTLQITGSGVRVLDNLGRSSTFLDRSGIEFSRSGISLGKLEYVTNTSDSGDLNNMHGFSMRPNRNSYFGVSYFPTNTATTSIRRFAVSGRTGNVYISGLIKPSEQQVYGIDITWGGITGRGTNVRIMNHDQSGGIQIDNGDLSYLTSNGWRSLNDRLS